MIVGYARVSTKDQILDRQVDELIDYGIDKRNIYKETISGTKRERPELVRMLEDLMPGDIVIVSELSRVSRSTKDLFLIVEQIQLKGADIKSLRESWLDTTTPQGKLMFTIFAGLSQFERDLISQRTKAGLKAAKARGRNGGRPSKQNEKADVVKLLYGSTDEKTGRPYTIKKIAQQAEISVSTVNRIIRNFK